MMLREHRDDEQSRDRRKESKALFPPKDVARNGEVGHPSQMGRGDTVESSGRSRRTFPQRDRERSMDLRLHGVGVSGALSEIESLLVDSGVDPAQVLQDDSPYSQGLPYRRQRDERTALFRDPTGEIPQSLMMLMNTWERGEANKGILQQQQQQLYQNQYLYRLEQELAETMEQRAATCELLFCVTLRKDVAELCVREAEARCAVAQDAGDAFAALCTFFYERRFAVRESLWRVRLEKEALRNAVAEERLREKEHELEEQRRVAASVAASASAERATLRREQEQLIAKELSTVLQNTLSEGTKRIADLVDAVPAHVLHAVQQASAQHSSPSSSLNKTPCHAESSEVPSNASSVQLQSELKSMITQVMREQLGHGSQAEATPSAAPPAAAPRALVSPVAHELSVKHHTLLFNKVMYILDSVEDDFTRAESAKIDYVGGIFVQEATTHARTARDRWFALLSEKRAEVQALREELLSLRVQRQQLLLQGVYERTGSQSVQGREGGVRTAPLQSVGDAQEGSISSFGAASASERTMSTNAAYEQFALPFIPPALRATKAPVKQSLTKLREEALRAGVRPADVVTHAPSGTGKGAAIISHVNQNPSITATSSDSNSDGPVVPARVSPNSAAKLTSKVNPASPLAATLSEQPMSLDRSVSQSNTVVKSFKRRSLSSSSSSSSAASAATREEAAKSEAPQAQPERTKAKDDDSDAPVKVSVVAQRVIAVGTMKRSAASPNRDESESSPPRIIESTMNSKPTERAEKETTVVRSTFDDSSLSDSSSPPSAGPQGTLGSSVIAKAAPTKMAPAASAASPLKKEEPAKTGHDAVHSFISATLKASQGPSLMTSATNVAPATVAPTAKALVKPFSPTNKTPATVDENSDSLSLTLTTSDDDDESPNPKSTAAGTAKKATTKAAKKNDISGDTSASPSDSPPSKGKTTETPRICAKVPAPAMRRSAFDDDDDDNEAGVHTTTSSVRGPARASVAKTAVAAVASTKAPPTVLATAAVSRSEANSASVTGESTLSSKASKKSVKLPW